MFYSFQCTGLEHILLNLPLSISYFGCYCKWNFYFNFQLFVASCQHRNTIDFYRLTLYPVTLLSSLSSSSFGMDSGSSSLQIFILFANKDCYLFLPNLCGFSFFLLPCCNGQSHQRTTLNKRCESTHLYLVPKEKGFSPP